MVGERRDTTDRAVRPFVAVLPMPSSDNRCGLGQVSASEAPSPFTVCQCVAIDSTYQAVSAGRCAGARQALCVQPGEGLKPASETA